MFKSFGTIRRSLRCGRNLPPSQSIAVTIFESGENCAIYKSPRKSIGVSVLSRLESVIRRLQAQRACLDFAARTIGEYDGVVFELGLGNGRTYDHLRSMMPDRDIYVFDKQIAAHPSCIPDSEHMILGEITDTLPAAVDRFRGQCIFLHCDIGTGVDERDNETAKMLSGVLGPVLAENALVASDQKLNIPGCNTLVPPDDVPRDRYFLLRKTAG